MTKAQGWMVDTYKVNDEYFELDTRIVKIVMGIFYLLF